MNRLARLLIVALRAAAATASAQDLRVEQLGGLLAARAGDLDAASEIGIKAEEMLANL